MPKKSPSPSDLSTAAPMEGQRGSDGLKSEMNSDSKPGDIAVQPAEPQNTSFSQQQTGQSPAIVSSISNETRKEPDTPKALKEEEQSKDALARPPSSSQNGSQSAAAAAAAAASTAAVAAAAANSSSSNTPSNAFRPLNVRDALQYLDRVKQQFSTEYEVYDKFLTIMKDFKTQNIDTPGVIDRVSTLFRGHPSLIQGFNTFLPPGYRIECSVSATDGQSGSNVITVTTPMGVTTRTQDVNGNEAREFARMQPSSLGGGSTSRSSRSPQPGQSSSSSKEQRQQEQSNSQQQSGSKFSSSIAKPRLPSPPGPIPPFNPQRAQARRAQLAAQQQAQAQLQAQTSSIQGLYGQSPYGSPAQPSSSGINNREDDHLAATEASDAAGTLANHSASASAGGQSGGPPVMEFNHAINYVNKIKNRFAKDPDTYKTFLEILQTYQKETRPIQEVYQQVTVLFADAPDLLDEFKAFLPDTNDPSASSLLGGMGAGQVGQPTKSRRTGESSRASGHASSSRNKNADNPEKKKRSAPGTSERSKAKRAKTSHAQEAASQSSQKQDRAAAMDVTPAMPPPGMPVSQPYGAPPPGFPGAPRMQSAYDAYLANHRSPPLVQPEEFAFFDRVKKCLDDRAAYTEFLKVLNLFTQEIIDARTLLEMALPFIGNSAELVAQMKELIGWDHAKDGRVKGEEWVIDNEPVLDRARVELHLLKTFGPSYRKLPDSEIDLACSGRSPLDWSVLNDDWVAYATWASEGSGMHRKNPYEDALYNSEQERHWYSFQIDSLNRTIAHFEPIASRIVQMTTEERANFRLGEDLGGPSPSIYTRIIRKIWGKDAGWDIVEALEENPAAAVPIVLSRLKQKDEEWKRAEREWNKVWREVDTKNYYRALDHQALTFKVVDKKNTMTSKTLTTEIENLREDGANKRSDLPEGEPLRPRHQLEFGFANREVFFDALKLTFSYLDRDQSGFSAPERVRVEAFLRLFIPLMFNISNSEMERNLAATDELVQEQEREDEADNDSDTEMGTSDAETHATESDAASKRGGLAARRSGVADLRKRLLTHATSVAAKNKGALASRAPSPTAQTDGAALESNHDTELVEQMWIQLTGVEGLGLDEPLAERRFNCFANTTFYCLVRTLQTLYHRLLEFKHAVDDLANKPHQPRVSPLAVQVGLANPIPVIDTCENGSEGANPASQYYDYALDLAEKMFDGDVDQSQFEDVLRYMVGIKAFPLFTIDKLCATIIKHIHTINGDSKCQDLVSLLEKDRLREAVTPRQQIAYRMEAESIIGSEESLYRLEWLPEAQALTIQLLGNDDLTLDEAYGDEERMRASWVASYSLTSPTEGIGCAVNAPLLKRNRLLSPEKDTQKYDLHAGLEAKLSEDGYALTFVANTEDFLFRRAPSLEQASDDGVKIEPLSAKRKRRFEKWLERQGDSNGAPSAQNGRTGQTSSSTSDGRDEDADMADAES